MDQENSGAHPRAACVCCKVLGLLRQSPWQTLPDLPLFGHDAAVRLQGKVPGGGVTAAGKGAGLGGPVAGSVVSTVTECDWVPPSDRRVPAGCT